MGKIIAVANHKGGVGKTTSVASIGAILSEMGKRVLLVDLDAQANLTSSLIKEEQENTIYKALKGDEPLHIVEVKDRLFVIPSSLELAGIELELSGRMSREFILKELLEPHLNDYDYILLDCPPSLGLITINALTAATDLYIALTAEALPTKGLKMLLDITSMVQKRLNKEIALTGVIITRWEKSNLSLMVEETLRESFGDVVFTTKIRKNVQVAEAPLHSKDILAYAPQSNGAKDYRALVEEIISRTEK